MANFCEYYVRVKGRMKEALTLYCSMPVYDGKDIIKKEGTSEEYIVEFAGACAWSLNYNCKKLTNDIVFDVDKVVDDDGDYQEVEAREYRYYTLQDKSRILN